MEPFESDEHMDTEAGVVGSTPAPVTTAPVHYDVLDDDDWED